MRLNTHGAGLAWLAGVCLAAAPIHQAGAAGPGPIDGAPLLLMRVVGRALAYRRAHGHYTTDLHALGVELEAGTRYVVLLAPRGRAFVPSAGLPVVRLATAGSVIAGADRTTDPQATAALTLAATGCPVSRTRAMPGPPLEVGVSGTGIQRAVLAVAAGNLDDDPTLDCWSIATVERLDARGATIPALVPYHEQADLPGAPQAALPRGDPPAVVSREMFYDPLFAWHYVLEVESSVARRRLKALVAGEARYAGVHHALSADPSRVGLSTGPGSRYAYFLARQGPLAATGCPVTLARATGGPPLKVGVTGQGARAAFVAVAAANLDSDPAYDCWSVSNVARRTADGRLVPAGEPLHEQDDARP